MSGALASNILNNHNDHRKDAYRVPVQTRSERFASTDVADFAKPSAHDFVWKNTPIAKLEPLTGELGGSAYEIQTDSAAGADGVTIEWAARDSAVIGSSQTLPEDYLSAAAWSGFEKALSIDIAADADLAEPVVVSRKFVGAPAAAVTARAAHTVITARQGAKVIVVLRNSGDAALAENVEIIAEPDATLTVVSVQEWGAASVHNAEHFINAAKNATVKHVVVTLGGELVRINPSARFAGPGASVELDGLYFADAHQHLEHQVYVDHNQADCVSRVTYKGALQGVGAHTVWIGDVLIRPEAKGTDTYELNRNLMLTSGCRADSVPNLEIETGNIVGAGHASATGRFDDEQLFYFESRGISEEEAKRIVVKGFLLEVIQRIGYKPLEEHLEAAVDAEIAQTVVK